MYLIYHIIYIAFLKHLLDLIYPLLHYIYGIMLCGRETRIASLQGQGLSLPCLFTI